MSRLLLTVLAIPLTVLATACGSTELPIGEAPTGDSGADSTSSTGSADSAFGVDAGDDGVESTHTSDALTTELGTGTSTTAGDSATDVGSHEVDGLDAGPDSATDAGSRDAVSDAIAIRRGPAPVLLGAAGDYVILAESAISTVPASRITGDLGISPAAATYDTGFSMTRAGTYWTATQVVGKIFAADNDPPTPTLLTTAITNMDTAYTDAAGRPTPDFLNLGVGAIGGLTLVPGLYKWTTAVGIGSDVVLSGGADDTWIFQVNGNLTEASAKRVTLSGGARAKNIWWQVSGFVDLAASSHFEGVILSKTSITLRTGASINGRLLAQTAVHLDTSTVTLPSP